jgi:hypothetical protein
MVVLMMDITKREKNMEKELINGQMDQFMMVNGLKIKLMELEHTNGVMEEYIQDNGKII